MARALFSFFDYASKKLVDVVEFDLFDNLGVRAWQYAVMLNPPQRTISTQPAIIYKPSKLHTVELQYQSLQSIIHQLSITDFAWLEKIPDTVDFVDQNLLNRLHRHFTNSNYTLWDFRYDKIGDSHANNLLSELNSLIHQLEEFVPTNNKITFGNSGSEIWAHANSLMSYDIFPYRQYHSFEPADLILDAHILGKTLLASFACEDNPSNWDTNGHMRTSGGAIILLENQRTEIYANQKFDQWLLDHGTNKNAKLADFPLGNFVTGHRAKLASLMQHLQQYTLQVHIQL